MDNAPQTATPTASNQAWMITFADLAALLLTFFVLLVSMSTVSVPTWEAIVDSLKQELNPALSSRILIEGAPFRSATVFVPQAVDLDYLNTLIFDKISEDPILANAILTRRPGGLVVSLPADTLFAAGSADLTDLARDAAFVLGNILGLVGNRIDVNGHSDPVPIVREKFPSNWELSIARALALATALRDSGLNKDLAVFGFADSRYTDISADIPEDRRLALGRRVDVVIREDLDDAEAEGP